jgi:hypothetical protein
MQIFTNIENITINRSRVSKFSKIEGKILNLFFKFKLQNL